MGASQIGCLICNPSMQTGVRENPDSKFPQSSDSLQHPLPHNPCNPYFRKYSNRHSDTRTPLMVNPRETQNIFDQGNAFCGPGHDNSSIRRSRSGASQKWSLDNAFWNASKRTRKCSKSSPKKRYPKNDTSAYIKIVYVKNIKRESRVAPCQFPKRSSNGKPKPNRLLTGLPAISGA